MNNYQSQVAVDPDLCNLCVVALTARSFHKCAIESTKRDNIDAFTSERKPIVPIFLGATLAPSRPTSADICISKRHQQQRRKSTNATENFVVYEITYFDLFDCKNHVLVVLGGC